MIDGLKTLGVTCEGTEDGAIIQGMGHDGYFGKGTVVSHEDHRISMSFSMASLRAAEEITIEDCANVATSFPNFVDLSVDAGLELDVLRSEEHTSELQSRPHL